jgi:3-phosphoshikimate 1-carboxyvinyltransferase
MSLPVSITLPRSKSIVIRCLLINYLKNGTLLPIFEDDPNDIKVVYNALRIIDSRFAAFVQPNRSVIDVEDCGAAYRFLMALLAVTHGKWLLTGTPRLLERPILPLVDFLKAQGANIEKMETGWQIEGKEIQIDNFEIDTSETSQFASAVMMVSDSRIQEFKNSKIQGCKNTYAFQNQYIRMTASVLKDMDERMAMLADWSAAVFWLANAMLVPNAYYFLENLHFDGLQGDATIASWFEKWGLCVTEKDTGIEVKHHNYLEISEQQMDVAQTPDIAMIMAVLSICYPFELTMSGLRNLNLKESNRLDIMVKELANFTKIKKHSEDAITIYKRTEKLQKKFDFDSYNDHRFVIAWSLFKNFGIVNIQNSQCIKKSYPNFKP